MFEILLVIQATPKSKGMKPEKRRYAIFVGELSDKGKLLIDVLENSDTPKIEYFVKQGDFNL